MKRLFSTIGGSVLGAVCGAIIGYIFSFILAIIFGIINIFADVYGIYHFFNECYLVPIFIIIGAFLIGKHYFNDYTIKKVSTKDLDNINNTIKTQMKKATDLCYKNLAKSNQKGKFCVGQFIIIYTDANNFYVANNVKLKCLNYKENTSYRAFASILQYTNYTGEHIKRGESIRNIIQCNEHQLLDVEKIFNYHGFQMKIEIVNIAENNCGAHYQADALEIYAY